jgi:hypothetical protein
MTGNVDKGDPAAAGEIHPGESQVDRKPPALLLLEPIGIAAGESLDQSRFAVIDVSGGGDY